MSTVTKRMAALCASAMLSSLFGVAAQAQVQTPPQMQTPNPQVQTQNPTTAAMPPMVVQINSRGNGLVRGTLQSIGSDSFTIRSWGGDWTVRLTSTTRVLPQGTPMSQFHTGDFVGASGMADQTSPLTLRANVVHDWGLQMSAQRTLFTGVVMSIAQSTLSLRGNNGTTYTVNISPTTRIWDMYRRNMPAANIQSGDQVRIDGYLSNATISAVIIHDMSRAR